MHNVFKHTLKSSAGQETRAAFIQAATEVFLRDGFRAARVTDIAKQAGQRVSAINYHFTNKEGLYAAVLQHHANLALQYTPFPTLNTELTPRQRLAWVVGVLVERLVSADQPSRIGALLLREMVNPTTALDLLIEQFSMPQAELVMRCVREIVGAQVADATIKRCAISIFGQCAAYALARPLISRLDSGFYQDEAAIQNIVDHVLAFSWAGLLAIRQQWEETL